MDIDSAVVLAAGEGRRLRPLTKFRPKPMLPAATRPILQHVFDGLIDSGIDDIHVIIGYQRDRVRNYFDPTYRDRTLTYHIQETQLGSGHALLQAADAVDDDFLVVNGDEVIPATVAERVIDTHCRESVATLAVVESEEPRDYAGIKLDDDRVTMIDERPDTGQYRLFNAGVYAFGPSVFSEIQNTPQTEGERALTDTIVELVERTGNVRGVRVESPRVAVTYPWDLLRVATGEQTGVPRDVQQWVDGVHVAESAMIHDNANVRSPAVIGPDAVVEAGAVVGPDTAVGRNATVAANATVQGSVIDDDTRVGEGATLVDTVTGTDVEIGPGVIIPGGPADIRIGTTIYEGRQLGAVVADRATIGGGATVCDGALVGPEVRIAAGSSICQNIAARTEVTQ